MKKVFSVLMYSLFVLNLFSLGIFAFSVINIPRKVGRI